MKQLTKEQVNQNIERLFPGKGGRCVDTYSPFFYAPPIYLIHFPGKGMIAVDEKKQVFVKWPGKQQLEKIEEYRIYCEDFNKMYITKQFKGMLFIPFVWNRKTANEDHLTQQDQFLECVGYAKKIKAESDLSRLQKLVGKDYVNFYKVIQEIKLPRAYMETKETRYQKIEVLTVEHMNGKFSFPIFDLVPSDAKASRQVADIFFNLLGIDVSSKISKAA